MTTLSIIIIAKDEAHDIADCVRSASFANEVIVIDSGSRDNTTEIAREMGAKVHIMDWIGYGQQKNRGIVLAQSDWVLFLDADERISIELQVEILQILENPLFDGYRIPRLSNFCGKFIFYSGWRPDYVLRFVKKEKARFSEVAVHETLLLEGKQANLKNSIIHYSYRNWDEVLSKLNLYAISGAETLFEKGVKASFPKACGHATWAFLRTWLLRLGFLDGRHGFMLAVYNAEVTYYKYLKLMELWEESDKP